MPRQPQLKDDILSNLSNRGKAEEAISKLAEATSEIELIDSIVKESHPDMWARKTELLGLLPNLREEAKAAMRFLGKGNHDLSGFSIAVKAPPITLACREEELILRAEERGEVQDLIDAGVLKYAVNVHQIERLEGRQKAIYSQYVTKKPGTASVTLPSALK